MASPVDVVRWKPEHLECLKQKLRWRYDECLEIPCELWEIQEQLTRLLQLKSSHPFIDDVYEAVLVEILQLLSIQQGFHLHFDVKFLVAAILLHEHTLTNFQAHPTLFLNQGQLSLFLIFRRPGNLLVKPRIAFPNSLDQIIFEQIVVDSQLKAVIEQLVVDFGGYAHQSNSLVSNLPNDGLSF